MRPMVGCRACALRCGQRASDGTQKTRCAEEFVHESGQKVQVDLTGKAVVGGIPLPLDLRGRVPARR